MIKGYLNTELQQVDAQKYVVTGSKEERYGHTERCGLHGDGDGIKEYDHQDKNVECIGLQKK